MRTVPTCQTPCSKNWSVQLGLQCTGQPPENMCTIDSEILGHQWEVASCSMRQDLVHHRTNSLDSGHAPVERMPTVFLFFSVIWSI